MPPYCLQHQYLSGIIFSFAYFPIVCLSFFFKYFLLFIVCCTNRILFPHSVSVVFVCLCAACCVWLWVWVCVSVRVYLGYLLMLQTDFFITYLTMVSCGIFGRALLAQLSACPGPTTITSTNIGCGNLPAPNKIGLWSRDALLLLFSFSSFLPSALSS